ncbi:unnamed protein product [Rhizoctonia solani]|uniref:Ricin B lectin domain-containing protein n=1 Tax=Rhizoctonia solani TaxID=456999 RepID=A0A8H3E5V1_9AGAM|nr:unnamed protein product [Rhizoctonia solani]CAE7196212.1 unnamed protein product [Rhizoctonia solani]
MAAYAMQLVNPGFQLFRRAAGHGVEHSPVDTTVEPGTYRIVSGLTRTALQISEYDDKKIVSWELVEKSESQQWYLQRSGGGYRFKNRKHESYLSVASTDTHAIVTASKFPSTWVLLKLGDHHGIKLADHDQLVDLHFGRTTNGTEIHIWPADGKPNKVWELVRISDDSGEPHLGKCAQLDQDLAMEKDRADKLKKILADEKDHAERLEKSLTKVQREVIEKDQQITQLEDTIHQLREALGAKESSHLQEKLAQQQTEIAGLQAKIDRLEYLVSQLRGSATRNPAEGR